MKDLVSGISLRLRHPSVDVGSLLEKWGLTVGRAWIAGSARTSPRGHRLEGNWPQSYAFARLPVRGRSLGECLAQAIAATEPFAEELRNFAEAGGAAELFVGWQFDANSGDVLAWQLLQRMADARLALSFDLYPGIDLN